MLAEKHYIGIDSGSKGAIAHIVFKGDEITSVTIKDFPTEPKSFIDEIKKEQGEVQLVVLEAVHAIPGQSSKSMFSYGGNFKLAQVLAFKYDEGYLSVSPQRWKKHFGLMKDKNETKSEWKGRSVEKARDLLGPYFTFKKSKDGQAEAALLALYGRFLDE